MNEVNAEEMLLHIGGFDEGSILTQSLIITNNLRNAAQNFVKLKSINRNTIFNYRKIIAR